MKSRGTEVETWLDTALVPFAWLAQPEREWNGVGCWRHLFNKRCESDGRHAVPFQHAHGHIPSTPPPHPTPPPGCTLHRENPAHYSTAPPALAPRAGRVALTDSKESIRCHTHEPDK